AAGLRADAARAQVEEYHRLLYVALTRAEDALFVAGWRGRNAPPADCWYNLIARGLASISETQSFEFADPLTGTTGEGLRLTSEQAPGLEPHGKAAARRGTALAESVAWDRRPAAPEA